MFRLLFVFFAFGASAAFADEPVYPPGSRIGLVPPPGMTVSRTFQGFEDRPRGAAIILTELSLQSFEKVALDFEPDAMKAGGMETISRETMPLQRGDARLVIARQAGSGAPVYKWALLTRAADMTVIVLATLPEAARDAYPDAALRAAFSSVIVRAKLTSDEMLAVLPYRLTDLGGFRLMRTTPDGTAVLTFGPNDTPLPVEQPYFSIAWRAVEPPPPAERDSFARRALLSFGARPDLRIVGSEAIRIGGAPGHEIVTESKDDRTGDDLMSVQWLLFGGSGVVQMFGIARKDQWAHVMPQMRALRDGFQYK